MSVERSADGALPTVLVAELYGLDYRLVLYTANDDADEAAGATRSLVVGDTVVACAPHVAGHPRVFTLLRDIVADAVGGLGGSVRLVMLGPVAGSVRMSEACRDLADFLGVPVSYDRGVGTETTVASTHTASPAVGRELGSAADGAAPDVVPIGLSELVNGSLWDGAARAASPREVPSPVRSVGSQARPAQPVVAAGTATGLRVTNADPTPAEWQMVRSFLAGAYDANMRLVTRALAEQPGLRVHGQDQATVAGLVALRAVGADIGDEINRVLRRPAEPDRAAWAELMARSASIGLRRLPTALGPVFRSSTPSFDVVDRYGPGDRLVEPAFLGVHFGPARSDAGAVQFVIWSIHARRLDRFDARAPWPALFAPGSTFGVLAVDPAGQDGTPARVYLRELVTTATPRRVVDADEADLDARIIGRLRGQLRQLPEQALRSGETVDSTAVGLDERGQRFVLADAAPAREARV